ncbi:uncharacterized protein LOC133831796 [Humulus lupulus]|uniref:uncharacterized protein LOC133831796 n=1 Tax=Humulus lupulus TaxID=3486 RepID=UPI002B4149EA|nr:uncharacterized protein LOC133831796 [Humulus lupulus]
MEIIGTCLIEDTTKLDCIDVNDVGYYGLATKLLWRVDECWNECLKLLGVAEAAEASMDSDQLSSGISDFDTHFQGLIVQKSQLSNVKSVERSSRPFVMRVLDDEVDDIDNAYEEAQDRSSLSANRFNFNDLYVSDDDDSENESALEIQPYLMEETGLVEGGLMS